MRPPETNSRIEWDSEIPGFGARITAAGVISFVLDYRIFGRQRRYTIGRLGEYSATAAREKARKLRVGIDDGQDPLEERNQSRSEPTLDDLLTEYLDSDREAKKRPNTRRDDKRMVEKIIRPRLGRLRLKAVGRRDIEALHVSLKETPYQANRVLALLSTIFRYAIDDLEWITTSPVAGIQRFPEEKREACLTIDQLQKFREALDGYSDQNAANALRLLMLTGSRAGETLRAEWEEIDLERGVWTKPSHHTKQKKTEFVPLSEPALELLLGMKPKNAVGPLFPGGTKKKARARVSLRRPWIQACKAAGLVTIEVSKGKRRTIKCYRPTVRIHDLRHSYASHLVSAGTSLQIVGKLLGHTQAATTMRYAHLQDESLRAATNQLAKIIAFEKKGA
jgi:integrase